MNGWKRVTAQEPCPICGKPDWCMVKEDGSAALCPRTLEGCERRRDGSPIEAREGQGWLHELKDQPRDAGRARIARRAAIFRQPDIDCATLAARYARDLQPDDATWLAESTGLTPHSLGRLELGWDTHTGAYTFPMKDGNGKTIGFRTRHPNGDKRAIAGSRSGLFIPLGITGHGPLMICEGPTDTAAALMLGYDAIGRHSCRGGVEHTAQYLRSHDRRQVWIMADSDTPGMDGAEAMADAIDHLTQGVKVLTPPRHKDIRAWVNAGGTRPTLDAIAANRTSRKRRTAA